MYIRGILPTGGIEEVTAGNESSERAVSPAPGRVKDLSQWAVSVVDDLADTVLRDHKLILAHAIMVRSWPEQEETLQEVPAHIQIWFNEEVGEEYAALAVINGDGKRVDNRDGQRDSSDRSLLKVTLPPISPGTYLVRWRVLSADGHVVSGKFNFILQ